MSVFHQQLGGYERVLMTCLLILDPLQNANDERKQIGETDLLNWAVDQARNFRDPVFERGQALVVVKRGRVGWMT